MNQQLENKHLKYKKKLFCKYYLENKEKTTYS